MTTELSTWIDTEYRLAIPAMLRSISPVDIVKSRPGFGQSIEPRVGSVIASPVLGAYDPDPDYFFHWYRDSAVVIDALRLLYENGDVGPTAMIDVLEFARFSIGLLKLDGQSLVRNAAWRDKVEPDFRKYLRDDEDLDSIRDSAIAADTRVNPDGTLDISKWNRPQHDGPPLRALALLRWDDLIYFSGSLGEELAMLIRFDLAFTYRHCREASYDIWEEEKGTHYYTLRVSAAALEEGALWLVARGDDATAKRYLAEAESIRRALDGFWLEEKGYYRSRLLADGSTSTKELDIAVILSAVHSGKATGPHSALDPRMQSTLARLEELFARLYEINRDRPAGRGVAMGRYEGDVYYSGGAYYFSTLGAAEFCYRAAIGADDARDWIARGDAFLETVRAFTPASGDLSEQFDQRTGEQTSAKHLAWSYAAFISSVTVRRLALGSLNA